MFEERLAEFSRERLDGRPIPDDLRAMLEAEWGGRTEVADLLGLTFFEPGQLHPLLDTSYLSEKERADPEMQAVNAAAAEMARYVKLVAEGGKGWIGYWHHPDEPADVPTPLIELDTEFTYWSMAGRTLAEACAADQAEYHDEPDERRAFALLSAQLAEFGLPLGVTDYDALDELEFTVDPEELTDDLIDAERARRGLG
ncbi:hypothetical protein [Streptomyces sp. NPDC059122]|uniref:hypothetical protein n=1 Tax=unclassified Streptomyces TaxID=2593676 RepID=UPI0036D09680